MIQAKRKATHLLAQGRPLRYYAIASITASLMAVKESAAYG